MIVKIIKIVSLIIGALVIAGIAMTLVSIWGLEAETRDFHASIKQGNPFTSFKVPQDARIIFIDFKPAVDSKEKCLGLMFTRERLMSFEPKPWAKPLADRNQLLKEIEALRPEVDRCSVMEWTLQGSTPYRGTVRIHYRNGIVERVDEPYFWD